MIESYNLLPLHRSSEQGRYSKYRNLLEKLCILHADRKKKSSYPFSGVL